MWCREECDMVESEVEVDIEILSMTSKLSRSVRYLCSTDFKAGKGSSPLACEKDISCFQDPVGCSGR